MWPAEWPGVWNRRTVPSPNRSSSPSIELPIAARAARSPRGRIRERGRSSGRASGIELVGVHDDRGVREMTERAGVVDVQVGLHDVADRLRRDAERAQLGGAVLLLGHAYLGTGPPARPSARVRRARPPADCRRRRRRRPRGWRIKKNGTGTSTPPRLERAAAEQVELDPVPHAPIVRSRGRRHGEDRCSRRDRIGLRRAIPNREVGMADLEYEVDDGVGTILLNRPAAKNAFTLEMIDQWAAVTGRRADRSGGARARAHRRGRRFLLGGRPRRVQPARVDRRSHVKRNLTDRIHRVAYALAGSGQAGDRGRQRRRRGCRDGHGADVRHPAARPARRASRRAMSGWGSCPATAAATSCRGWSAGEGAGAAADRATSSTPPRPSGSASSTTSTTTPPDGGGDRPRAAPGRRTAGRDRDDQARAVSVGRTATCARRST